MADNLDTSPEFDDIQPVYEEETRAYEPEPPDRNYTLDDIDQAEDNSSAMNWLLVGLIALAAVITGLLIYYFLFNNGGNGGGRHHWPHGNPGVGQRRLLEPRS